MLQILPIILILIVAGLAAFGVVMYMQRKSKPDLVEQRLAEFVENPVSLETLELEQPFNDRVVKPMLNLFSKIVGSFTPAKSQERLRRNLAIAGNPNNLTVGEFMGIRLLASFLVGGIIAGLLFLAKASTGLMVLFIPIFFVVGYLLPAMWLGSKMKKRKKSIQRAMPDAIDLLTISVEAGLGFDQALTRVTEKWDHDLGREFKRMLSEQRVGKPRRDALREMAARCDVQDLNIFVASIVQADQLGVSMTKVLRIQADQMRIRRRQLAEELAHKAPIKMLFPMVFLIFPTIYIVILGPVVPTVAKSFGFGG